MGPSPNLLACCSKFLLDFIVVRKKEKEREDGGDGREEMEGKVEKSWRIGREGYERW